MYIRDEFPPLKPGIVGPGFISLQFASTVKQFESGRQGDGSTTARRQQPQ
jgi:hypothetical protein